jgi:hypothetical protein
MGDGAGLLASLQFTEIISPSCIFYAFFGKEKSMEKWKNEKLTDCKTASHQADNKVRFQLAATFAVLDSRKGTLFNALNAARRLRKLPKGKGRLT